MKSPSGISHQDIEEFAPNIVMDATRARTVLGWRPAANFRTELQKLIDARV